MSDVTRAAGLYDQPDALEIVRRVARFLDEEVYGSVAEHKVNYRVRVAANLLRLVERELSATSGTADGSGLVTTATIAGRFGGVAPLAELLESGRLSIVDRTVFDELRAHTALKVDIAAIHRPSADRTGQQEEST